MPMFVGTWMEILDQVRNGRQLDCQILKLKKWLVSDPMSMVPKSKRAQAELNLRTAEYLAMIGQDETTVSRDDIQKQELRIMDAQKNVEKEAKTSLENDKDKLQNEAATKLDIAQLAVDLLSLGRTWSEHFNGWSASQEDVLNEQRAATKKDIQHMKQEIAAMRKEFMEQIGRLSSLVEDSLKDKI